MKYLSFFLVLLFTFMLNAQNVQRPEPESWNIPTIEKVVPIQLEKPNLKTLQSEDAINDLDKSIPWRFGYDHYVNYGIKNAGKWYSLPNGDRIWRISFISPGALTMNLIFDIYKVPLGGKVYVYNHNRSQILNTFTHLHNNPEEILGTWMLEGEQIWIEYFEPKKVSGQGQLNIGNVIHGYRTVAMFDKKNEKALNDSGDCNIDVNCDISTSSALANGIKDDVKKSVGMLVTGGNGFCTGALVNNTNNDQTPYFLTANHCLGSSVAGWAFRFNWASDASVADCATNAPSVDNTFLETASGAILRAANSESDMALVEITDTAFFTGNPDVAWAGWNRSTTEIPSLNVGVHHPRGDIQKLCVDFDGATRTVSDFNGNTTTEMWRVADWDLGVTEPGSSGSPLFDQDGLIIGKLSGGSAACNGISDNGGFDIYGRFGVSWDFGTTNATQLKFWLDPAGTNPMTLNQFPAIRIFRVDVAVNVINIPDTVCSDEITPTIRITNRGSNNLTSATISYQLDGDASNVINWTGNLATDAFEDIPLSTIILSTNGDRNFTASASNPNGFPDGNINNNNSTINFNVLQNFNAQLIKVIITPDRYGEETTWTLRDANNLIIASGGPYITVANNGAQPDEIQDIAITADGCYTFTLSDTFGDGICCDYGSGTYRLEDGNGNILVNGNGSFGIEAVDIIKINQSLSISEITFDKNLIIYPNPFSENITIKNTNGNNLSYEISNILGQKIKNGIINIGANSIDLYNQNKGFYFITITDILSNNRIIKKIIKR